MYSTLYDYYKFPGGGIESVESPAEALMREVREEAGLAALPQSIREYGMVRRRERGSHEDIFIQDNYYYLCDTAGETCSQALDAYEAREGFTLVYTEPRAAILANRNSPHGPKSPAMIEREARVLECLINEGYFPAAAH